MPSSIFPYHSLSVSFGPLGLCSRYFVWFFLDVFSNNSFSTEPKSSFQVSLRRRKREVLVEEIVSQEDAQGLPSSELDAVENQLKWASWELHSLRHCGKDQNFVWAFFQNCLLVLIVGGLLTQLLGQTYYKILDLGGQGCNLVIECLPIKHKALGFESQNYQKKKNLDSFLIKFDC